MERRLAIFSDIHGNFQALNAILKDIKEKEITEMYCLGDIIAIGPNPRECLDLIIENNIKMVLGNHELYFIKGTQIDDEMGEEEQAHAKWVREQLTEKQKKFLNNCALQIIEEIGEYKIAFQHFLFNPNQEEPYPFDDLNIVKDGTVNSKVELLNADITFIGHEHKSFEISSNNKRLIDVGSSGCTKDDETFYTILSIDDDVNIDKVYLKYDREEFEKSLNSIAYPDKEMIGKIFLGMK